MQHRFYHDATMLHPIGLMALLVLGALLLFLPRRYAFLPFALLLCFVPTSQRMVVAGLDFTLIRVMVMIGFVRVLVRSELLAFRWNAIDTVVVVFLVWGVAADIMLRGDLSGLVRKSGLMVDTVGLYLLTRFMVRSFDDVEQLVTVFAMITIPVTFAFLVEKMTARNPFSLFGGVPDTTLVRNGRLRCQGPFPHPIIAGCFFASFLPLWGSLFLARPPRRALYGSAIACALLIIIVCASSTPVMAVVFGLGGFAFLPLRRHMKWIRWSVVLTLFALHLFMKAPVWHLVARIDLVGGSTGYHRYQLIDSSIRNFGLWWKFGTLDTLRVLDYRTMDVTNQYLLEGLRGGFLLLVLFVLMLALGFKAVGRLVRAVESSRLDLLCAWALGVCLFQHMMNFLAVSYFGQVTQMWFLTLAIVSAVAGPLLGRQAVASGPEEPDEAELVPAT